MSWKIDKTYQVDLSQNDEPPFYKTIITGDSICDLFYINQEDDMVILDKPTLLSLFKECKEKGVF